MLAILALVGSLIVCFLVYIISSAPREIDQALLRLHDCCPPPSIRNHRLFGFDRIEEIFRAASERRLMQLFLFHFRQTAGTIQQRFLGTLAFGTTDPENIEAILHSKAQGRLQYFLVEPVFR